MDTQTLTYLFVGATFALYIGIAIWSRAGSTKEYYVASGGVHPIANGMATGGELDVSGLLYLDGGIISFVGRDGAVYLMGWTGGYVLLAMCLPSFASW